MEEVKFMKKTKETLEDVKFEEDDKEVEWQHWK